MRAALSHEFKVAIPAYDEKPRTKWIFDYSVQNTIMVSRTFFTQDVNEAFEELEEGNEDALKVSLAIDLESKLQLALPCLGARTSCALELSRGNAVSELHTSFDLGEKIRIMNANCLPEAERCIQATLPQSEGQTLCCRYSQIDCHAGHL